MFKCGFCGRFCIPHDDDTPFGCSNPDAPEPYDPTFYCEKCFDRHVEHWVSLFKSGFRHGAWQKSKAECKAAEICNLEWEGALGPYKETSKEPK